MRDDSRALASYERESVIDEERERYWHGRKPIEGELNACKICGEEYFDFDDVGLCPRCKENDLEV